jgi:energy-coupling factor transport system substrate-specific component
MSNLQDARDPSPAPSTSARLRKPGMATPPLRAWRSVDLITCAMLGAAFGVGFWVWGFVYNGVEPAFKAVPPLTGLLSGPWLLAGVVCGVVIRRPGAALFGEVVAAVVEMALGSSWAWLGVLSGALQGAGIELVFAIFLYRRFGPAVAGAAAALGAAFEVLLFERWEYYPGYSAGWILAYLLMFTVSAVAVAGVGGYLLTRALGRVGALAPFPAGRAVGPGGSPVSQGR